MIQKNSIVTPADKCGVLTVNTFHLYKGFCRKTALFGDYLKISVRKIRPENSLAKKTKRKALLIRTNKNVSVCDGTNIRYPYNDVIVLKKRLTPEGKELLGPILRTFKKKKFLSSFSGKI